VAKRNLGVEILEGLKAIKAGKGKRKTVNPTRTPRSSAMDGTVFEALTTSIREAGAIRCGKLAASRRFEFEDDYRPQHPSDD